MKATTEEWLDLAKADLMSCHKILDEEFLTNIVAFHSQQAIEKSFKAIIEEKYLSIPKIHSLQRLYAIVQKYFICSVDLAKLDILDEVYTNSRYPGNLGIIASGKPTVKEATEFYIFSKEVYNHAIKTIEQFK